MRCGGWLSTLVLGGWMLGTMGGCVSLNDYRKLGAQNRMVTAEKVQLEQELFDLRNNSGSVRDRVGSLERELADKDALIDNLRSENELLDEMRRIAKAGLDRMAGKMGDIVVTGPKLPKPLDEALKQFAAERPSEVEYDAQHGTVKWKADLLFALGSDTVRQSSLASLRSFAEIVKGPAAADFEVIVVGHTDNKPITRQATKAKHPTNWHLSAHRAISVGSILRKASYPPGRIAVMGCGEFRPIAENASETGRQRNRRVEVYLIPRGSIVKGIVGAAGLGS